MNLSDQINQGLASIQANTSLGAAEKLNSSLRLLGKWRSVLIQNTFINKLGTTVLQGPLAGLNFIEQSSEGCHIAKLIGCYEQPLHPVIYDIISSNYSTVLNIGSAEGYYAVGLARKMLKSKVMAFDLDCKAQEACRLLAKKNNVSDRVAVFEEFKPEDFELYPNEKVVVFCDIEGGEEELLRPDKFIGLKAMDLIVESHECLKPGITRKLVERFSDSHDIKVISDNGSRVLEELPEWFSNLAHLDQLLATWEWRSGPTPWLVMYAKSPTA